jgi:two-component system, sensor histidine kinase and response regulator
VCWKLKDDCVFFLTFAFPTFRQIVHILICYRNYMRDKSTILYLDDEQENLDAFYSVFRRVYHVLITTDPHEALRLLQKHTVKVIISDQRMPVMSGVEFLRNAFIQNPKATRILLTGYADMGAVISAINEGRIFLYVSKPWAEEDIYRQIEASVKQYDDYAEDQFLMMSLREYNHSLEEKVSLRTENLLDANKQLHHFMKIAAHDLKNPLSAVRSSAEILSVRGDAVVPDRRKQLTQAILDSSDRMLGIINNFLEDNARRQQNFKPFIDSFDVRTLIDDVLRENLILAERKSITLVFQDRASLHEEVYVWADKSAMQQVLDNLISNAVKFSPNGTTVNVRLRVDAEHHKVVITVQDEGPGISEEDAQYLFEEYSTLSARPTGGEVSTGLGLSIVKSLIESMKGRVFCDTSSGHGAIFVVELPMPQK